MCARPVQVSVTVMVGHEKVRNSSKDSKNTPQERSNLDAGRAWSVSQEGECVRHAAAPRNTMQLEVAHVGGVDLVGKGSAIPTQYTCEGARTDWRSYSQPLGSTRLKSDMTSVRLGGQETGTCLGQRYRCPLTVAVAVFDIAHLSRPDSLSLTLLCTRTLSSPSFL